MKDSRDRTSRWAYALLVVVIAAGAIGGVGVGSAATVAPAPDTSRGSTGDPNWWTLKNDTGQPIYGTWSQQVGKDVSELDLVKNMPLAHGGHESRKRYNSIWWNSYWMGHICYNHLWWNLSRSRREIYDSIFTLRVAEGVLQAIYNLREGGTTYSIEENLTRNWAEFPC
ncbi:hypothetical protein R3Q06_36245 [Rhodococcus erythropolis]|uniref:hypothetical protein n=1 Tax=Rhodococcus erythropolis TaxID=1833 RepID=UPI0029498FB1|nr:hypothetical protein [Rhodococcus erythropolis]MDV6278819.1 hypothetical protein [Rhodococcus erythropolis]